VFDVSQTDGKELPHIGTVQGDPREFTERLRSFAIVQGIAVEYSDQIAPARGMSSGGKITLLPGQSPAKEFSTLAHELLHRGEFVRRRLKRALLSSAEASGLKLGPHRVTTSSCGKVTRNC
jgi:hypothetical protein